MTDTMAEPRRVEFKTISSSKEEKKEKTQPLIPRFTLALGESTATTCPEYSFTELVKKEKAQPVSQPDEDDPFGDEDNDDEVAALARKFEKKYGPDPDKKKRKLKCLEDDYLDLGDGYDENDPFIDNTEAYDEVVPSCLTTKHGGFYINRGTLDFKTLSDQDDSMAEFFTPPVRKRGRPRKILDSDEDEQQAEEAEFKKKKMKKKKLKEGFEGEPKKKKKKMMLGPDGEKIIKRKKILNADKKKKLSPTVKELLKQQTASTAPSGVLNGNLDLECSPPASPVPGEKSARVESAMYDNLLDGEEKKFNGEEGGPNQLPTDLPAELSATVVGIKQAAKDTKEGKCKFFTPHVNQLLLDIELGSRQLAFGKRKAIYAHLAEHLPCGKETLIKRAKKLRENQHDDQLKTPVMRLKEEIDKVMPALQEQHEKEVARSREEIRVRREGAESLSQKEEGGNSDSDDDDKGGATPGTAEGQQSRKGNRDPRKKFKWNQEIKSLLCQIVGVKMRMFDTYKFRNQTAEEYLKTFLENEVKVLWPQGWIQTRMLYKETRSVHGKWTNPLKPKRPLLVGPRGSTASPTPSQPASTNNNAFSSLSDAHQQPCNDSMSPAHRSTPTTEVIEVSDIDEPTPTPTPAFAPKRDKPRAGSAFDVSAAESFRNLNSGGGDNLKFSPNSMEAMAAATAAVVAAAVSHPPPSKGDNSSSLFSSLSGGGGGGEGRRPHLVSEMMKKPVADVGGAGAGVGGSFPKSLSPRTPPTPLGGGKDAAAFSPYLAEFSRYLTHSASNSSPAVGGGGAGGVGATQPLSVSLAQQVHSQLQSKTVSSTSPRPHDVADNKKTPLPSSSTSTSAHPHLPPIQWQMDGLLPDKTRKQRAHTAQSAPAPPPPPPPAAHSGSSSGAGLDSAAAAAAAAHQARYHKMAALLMRQEAKESSGSSSQQQQQQQQRKSKGDIVRDQILSQIQAEIDAAHVSKSGGGGGNSSRLSMEASPGGRIPPAPQSQTQSAVRPSSAIGGGGVGVGVSRPSPAPAHSAKPASSTGASPVNRQLPPAQAHSPNGQRLPPGGAASSFPAHPRQQQQQQQQQQSSGVALPRQQQQQTPTPGVRGQPPAGPGSKQQTMVSTLNPAVSLAGGGGKGAVVGSPLATNSRTFQSQKAAPSQQPSPPTSRAASSLLPPASQDSSLHNKPQPSPFSPATAPSPTGLPFRRTPPSSSPSPSPSLSHSPSPAHMGQAFQQRNLGSSSSAAAHALTPAATKVTSVAGGPNVRVSPVQQQQQQGSPSAAHKNFSPAQGLGGLKTTPPGVVGGGQSVKFNMGQGQKLQVSTAPGFKGGQGLGGGVVSQPTTTPPQDQSLLLRRSSPTANSTLTSPAQRSGGGVGDKGPKVLSLPQGSQQQRLPGGSAGSGRVVDRNQALLQQIESEIRRTPPAAVGTAAHVKRAVPGQRSLIGQPTPVSTAAQMGSQSIHPGSNSVSATHSKPPSSTSGAVNSSPRPQAPNAVPRMRMPMTVSGLAGGQGIPAPKMRAPNTAPGLAGSHTLSASAPMMRAANAGAGASAPKMRAATTVAGIAGAQTLSAPVMRAATAVSGIAGAQSAGLNPPQPMVATGLFNHRPVFRPLHSQSLSPGGAVYKETPRLPQDFGQ